MADKPQVPLPQLIKDWRNDVITVEAAITEGLKWIAYFNERLDVADMAKAGKLPEMQYYRARELDAEESQGVELMAVSAEEAAKDFTQNWLVPEMAYNDASFEVLVADDGDYEHGFTVEVEMKQVTTVEHHDQDKVDDRVYLVLSQMEDSGQSETAGVADILNGIAANGGSQAVTSYLIGCAKEIIDAAQGFIDDVRQYT